MTRSISEGRAATGAAPLDLDRRTAALAGLVLVVFAVALYLASNPERLNVYNHFVWQADAFLHGRAWIPYPVAPTATTPGNGYFNDVFPLIDSDGGYSGRVLIPFPPLPALVLLPFVAVAGLAADQELVAIVLAGAGVGLAWWMLGGLDVSPGVRSLVTLFFATGTAWWWSAAVGSTWYFAHLVAVDIALVAVGLALRRDPAASSTGPPLDGLPPPAAVDTGDGAARPARGRGRGAAGRLVRATFPLERTQVLVGVLLGLAATARLPLVLATPFFVLVGPGATWQRRSLSFGVGAALPVAALLAYTWLTTGAFVHPGYEYQYRLEAFGYPTLGYHEDWAIEDVRYIPQNLGIMLGGLPAFLPDILPNTLGYGGDFPLCTGPGASRSLFDVTCPLAVPRDIGTSLLLTSPALLLALLPLARRRWNRLMVGSVVATMAIATFNLAHFSQGWVQWGYRFANDFLPFLLPLVAVGAGRGRTGGGSSRPLAIALVAASGVVNLWGVVWGKVLGW